MPGPVRIYDSPEYENNVLGLIMRSGNIAAQRRAETGQIWGQALSNIGQQVGVVLQKQQQQKRDAALDTLVQSWDGTDPDVLTRGSVKVLGPMDGLKFAQGLIATRSAMDKLQGGGDGPSLPEFQAQLGTALAAPATWRARNFPAFKQALAPGLKKFAGIDAATLGDQLTPDIEQGLQQLHDHFAPPSTSKPDVMETDQGFMQWDQKAGKWAPAPGMEGRSKQTKDTTAEAEQSKANEVWAVQHGGKPPADAAEAMKALGAYKASVQQPTMQVRVSTQAQAGQNLYSPEAIETMARNYLLTGQRPVLPMRGSAGQNVVAQFNNKVAELSQASGMLPGESASRFKANNTSLTKLQPQLDAVAAFEETARKNATAFEGLLSKLPDGGVRFLNTPLRAAASQFGSEGMAAIEVLRQSLQAEYGRIINNPNLTGVLTDTARRETQDLLAGNLTVAQTRKALQTLQLEAENRRTSYQGQLDEITKRNHVLLFGQQPGDSSPAPPAGAPTGNPATPKVNPFR